MGDEAYVQNLLERMRELESENKALRRGNAQLKQRLQALETSTS